MVCLVPSVIFDFLLKMPSDGRQSYAVLHWHPGPSLSDPDQHLGPSLCSRIGAVDPPRKPTSSPS